MSQQPPPLPPGMPLQQQPGALQLQYATPIVASTAGGIVREGKQLITLRNVELPKLCIKCNRPATWYKKRKIYWAHPAWLFLILVNIFVLLIVNMCVRKKAEISIGLCKQHHRRRVLLVLATWLLSLSAIASFVGGFSVADATRSSEWVAVGLLLGVILVIAACVVGFGFARLLTPVRMDDYFARFKGCGPDFLSNFPTNL